MHEKRYIKPLTILLTGNRGMGMGTGNGNLRGITGESLGDLRGMTGESAGNLFFGIN